ncbi:alkaline phosphatase D family protein [Gordonia hankookensis]|uniref:Alkaline phosphatase D family protein n=1 Tax=Gordonia hankookensis TaxID=589403 RepID=A0ABR7WG52_9ACTN|nr:alkaline phosphatase D family protein [Gordonia hankookensis]MBD1321760.1 alkaline phosphatase D family protein [Gordonia hankookensis]
MSVVSAPPSVPGDADQPGASSAEPSERSGINRRAVLRTGAVAAGVTSAGIAISPASATPAPRSAAVFAHGVASGDPLPDGVILWTRVTPTAASTPGSGRGPDVVVTWEIARDGTFARTVASGSVHASVDADHTVKVDVAGLEPDTSYVYRFRVASGPTTGATSPTGHTRTAPAAGADVRRVRFGVVSCANWEAGYFGAYRHLRAHRDLTAIVHLGDYFYEYETGGYGGKSGVVRRTEPANETVTLRDYRIRHAHYKTDVDLAELHRLLPWICTWDDHESSNDAWKGGAENHSAGEGPWAARKAASERAYYEWMPVRPEATGTGRHLYRRLRFGRLLELSMLDLRTYRDQQVSATSSDVDDPRRTITGQAQMRWLTNGLTSSPTRWQIIGNPVMIAPVLIPPLDARNTAAVTELLGLPGGGVPYNADQWDGYTADRRRLLDAIRDHRVDNVVFITGDIHSSWACDIPVDAARYPAAGSVATELVVPSVTSANIDDILGVPEHSVGAAVPTAIMAANRHVRWNDFDAHGYGVLTVTPAAAQMDWYFLVDKADPRTSSYHARSFRVPSGTPRVGSVAGPAD